MQPQSNKTEEHQKSMTISSSKNLLQNVASGNKVAVSMHLSKFKERGVVSFPMVLSIASKDRIPALAKTEEGRFEVLTALTASIKSAFSNINLRVGLNEDQMIELADAIIDQSGEDNLSLEDVLLFLQKLLVGDAGKIYDRMDIPTFFEKFELYRQDRHKATLRIREEQQVQYKALGNPERWSETHDKEKENSMHEAMKEYMKMTANKPENGQVPASGS